jgi:alkylation response protein AidB-like acyl-CoA dehydrogenase
MISQIIKNDLKPKTIAIDKGLYTTEILEKLGGAGCYRHHIPSLNNGTLDLFGAIIDMAKVSEECMTTGFIMWHQAVGSWYIENSDNDWLKKEILPKMVDGEYFGASALSNPMKHFAGIEDLKLTAEETEDGFIINGTLPWVSNLLEKSSKHFFGSIFAVHDHHGENHKNVMAMIPCDLDGLTMKQMVQFIGMEGSGTYSLIFDNAFLPKKYLLADPLKPYLEKIKAGFVLLQTGMAVGVIQSAIDDMRKSNLTMAESNAFLDDSPEELQEDLDGAVELVRTLCETPYAAGVDYIKTVLEARLVGAEYCKRAADAVMQYAGAKGYIVDAIAQRKMREAYFVIIVTPSIRHLRKEIASLA